MIAAALFLAATISTPSLGEIYTIPSWMPESVAAAATPGTRVAGSAPPAGSGRITADTYAAYVAAQEAVLERLYFARAGNGGSNPASAVDPSAVQYWFFAAPPYAFKPVVTNLVMSQSTRILPNDARKWVPAMFNQGGAIGFYYTLITPSFIGLYDSNGSSFNGLVSTSPSSTLLGDATPAFPAFGWTTDTASAVGSWTDRGLTFGNCAADFLLPYGVNQTLGFFGARSGLTNGTEVTRHPTLTSVLSNNFAAVDCRWLTNTTERLVWNRLAAADELLAAIDRIYLTETEWGNAYLDLVETSMTATRGDEGTLDISNSYLQDGYVYGYGAPGGWSTFTNYVAVTNRSWTSSGVEASVTSAGAGVDGMAASVSVGQFILSLSDIQDEIYMPWNDSITIYPESFTATFQGGVCNVVMVLHYTTERLTLSKTIPYNPPQSPLPVSLYATASATYTRTVAPSVSQLGAIGVPTWPSWRAFSTDRIKALELASLAHFSGDYGATNEWRCARAMPASINAIRSFAADDIAAQVQRCEDHIKEQTGGDPSSASYVAVLAAAAMDDAEANGVTVSFAVSFDLVPGAEADVMLVDGVPTEIINPKLGDLMLTPTVIPTLTGDHTRPACQADCDARQFYRADWRWKTLRMN